MKTSPEKLEANESLADKIAAAGSFAELILVIEGAGGIDSSLGFVKPSEVREKITAVCRGLETPAVITNTDELRTRVMELMSAFWKSINEQHGVELLPVEADNKKYKVLRSPDADHPERWVDDGWSILGFEPFIQNKILVTKKVTATQGLQKSVSISSLVAAQSK